MLRFFSAWLMLATLLHTGAAIAQRSHSIFYDQAQGLNAGEISALAQDRQGFLWLGTFGGLIRFDGRNFKPWGREQVHEPVKFVVASGGDLVVGTNAGAAFVRTQTGLALLRGPQGRPIRDLRAMVFDRQGRLWTIQGERLWRRDRDSRWRLWPVAAFAGETPRQLSVLADGVAVLTERGAWRLQADATPQLLLRAGDLFAASGGGARPYWFVDERGHRLWRKQGDQVHAFERPQGRALAIILRGDTLWVALDRWLLAVTDAGDMRVQGAAQGVLSGGPLLVDRENSLWMGTFVGLLQFPEPDSMQWTEQEGLPWAHAYGIASVGDDIWVTTWGGIVRFDAAKPQLRHAEAGRQGVLCPDGRGGLWAAAEGTLQRWHNGHYVRSRVAPQPDGWLGLRSCAIDTQGRTWLATTAGLFRAEGEQLRAVPLPVAQQRDLRRNAALIAADEPDVLWVLAAGQACRYAIEEPTRLHRPHCFATDTEAIDSGALQRIAPGRFWHGGLRGLHELSAAGTRRLPGNAQLPSSFLSAVRPARSGGYWAAGGGTLLRIEPCDGCSTGWRVLERPGAGQGLPGNTAIDMLELGNGDLWVVGNRGVVRVPAQARRVQLQPPSLELVRVAIDGAEHAPARSLRLRADQNRLTLEFSALSYRDRSLLRYRHRLSDDSAWSLPGTESDMQLVGLPAGAYRAQMQASLDGLHWSNPATLDFSVAPPWWATWWARLLWLALLAGLAVLAYRLRVAHLLRLARQRNEIAMDLHDEMGSGLGSIGVLASVAAREGFEEHERREIAREIASVASLLGSGLRSLVWTMREGRAGLAELSAQIADHARRLLPGPLPELSLQMPEHFPDDVVRPEVRRHVLMIALEALHNAARHAQAQRVQVALSPSQHGWQLLIGDDGIGFDPEHPPRRSGLDSMQRRARLIGARLDIESQPGNGMRLCLRFAPFAP